MLATGMLTRFCCSSSIEFPWLWVVVERINARLYRLPHHNGNGSTRCERAYLPSSALEGYELRSSCPNPIRKPWDILPAKFRLSCRLRYFQAPRLSIVRVLRTC